RASANRGECTGGYSSGEACSSPARSRITSASSCADREKAKRFGRSESANLPVSIVTSSPGAVVRRVRFSRRAVARFAPGGRHEHCDRHSVRALRRLGAPALEWHLAALGRSRLASSSAHSRSREQKAAAEEHEPGRLRNRQQAAPQSCVGTAGRVRDSVAPLARSPVIAKARRKLVLLAKGRRKLVAENARRVVGSVAGLRRLQLNRRSLAVLLLRARVV